MEEKNSNKAIKVFHNYNVMCSNIITLFATSKVIFHHNNILKMLFSFFSNLPSRHCAPTVWNTKQLCVYISSSYERQLKIVKFNVRSITCAFTFILDVINLAKQGHCNHFVCLCVCVCLCVFPCVHVEVIHGTL